MRSAYPPEVLKDLRLRGVERTCRALAPAAAQLRVVGAAALAAATQDAARAGASALPQGARRSELAVELVRLAELVARARSSHMDHRICGALTTFEISLQEHVPPTSLDDDAARALDSVNDALRTRRELEAQNAVVEANAWLTDLLTFFGNTAHDWPGEHLHADGVRDVAAIKQLARLPGFSFQFLLDPHADAPFSTTVEVLDAVMRGPVPIAPSRGAIAALAHVERAVVDQRLPFRLNGVVWRFAPHESRPSPLTPFNAVQNTEFVVVAGI